MALGGCVCDVAKEEVSPRGRLSEGTNGVNLCMVNNIAMKPRIPGENFIAGSQHAPPHRQNQHQHR